MARTVNFKIAYPNDEPWVGAILKFRFAPDDYTSTTQYPSYTISAAATDANGEGSIDLWQNANGAESTLYECILPSGETFTFVVPAGTTDIALSTLRGGSFPSGDFGRYFLLSSYDDLAAAITAIGATEGTLLIDKAETMDENVTSPATLSIVWNAPGNIITTDGYDFTINGAMEAGLYQILDSTGGGGMKAGNVRDSKYYPQWWGAVGDGVTDDAVAIQAAIDAVPTRDEGSGVGGGGTVFFIRGKYYITTGLTADTRNLALVGPESGVGVGPYGATSQANATARIETDQAITMFAFNNGGSSTIFEGPVIKNLMFRGDSSTVIGVHMHRVNNYVMENVIAANISTGTGFYFDGSAGGCQYGNLYTLRTSLCLIGIRLNDANGNLFFGGHIEGNKNYPTGYLANSTGVLLEAANSGYNTFYGMNFQGNEIGVDIEGGRVTSFIGCRFEAFDVGLKLQADAQWTSLYGGGMNNVGIVPAPPTDVGVLIEAGAENSVIFPGQIQGPAESVNDSGTNSTYFTEDREWSFGVPFVGTEKMVVPTRSSGTDTIAHVRNTNSGGVQETFNLEDDGGNVVEYATNTGKVRDDTEGAHAGAYSIGVAEAGSVVNACEWRGLPSDGYTAMLVRVNDGGVYSLQKVSMGADDSGGVGYKLLRVPN